MAEIIKQIVQQHGPELSNVYNVPENFFVCKENKETISVWITEPTSGRTKKLAFNYKKSKVHTFYVKNVVVDSITIPECAVVKKIKSDKLNTHIIFKAIDDSAVDFIKNIEIYYIEHFDPSDKFGCCGKYKECSKAKKCLHDNNFYARACWYKKNLESGKIFY